MKSPRRSPTALVVITLFALTMPPVRSQETRTVDVDGLSQLAIELDNGNVLVVGSNRNVIVLAGDVDVSTDATVVTVKRAGASTSPVSVACPEGLALAVRVGTGDVRLVNTRGAHDISVESGDISLEGVAGAIRVSVGSGRISGDFYPDNGGRIETALGNVDVRLRDGPRSELSVFAAEGTVRLVVSALVNAELDAQTDAGTIRSRLENALSLSSDGESKRAVGTLGDGGPLVRVTVRRGNIELESDAAANGSPERQRVPVPFARAAVVVKGESEPIWGDASAFPLRIASDDDSGEVRLLRDASHLFVYAALPVGDWNKVKAIAVEPDDASVNDDDAFDVFIGVEERAYRVSVNVLGSVYDARTLNESEDASWDADVVARTELIASSWVVELAIPFTSIGVTPVEGLELDADFAYVSPNHNESTPAETRLTFTSAIEASSTLLSVHGNGDVPLSAILRAVRIGLDGRIREPETATLESRLRRLGWFESVRVSVSDDSVVVELEGLRAFEVQDIRFLGLSVVSESFCRDRLGWRTGWTTLETVEARRRLTENFYRAQGYEITTVKTWLVGKTLFVDVDEGVIEDVIVSGASRIEPSEVAREMKSVVNVPFRAQAVADALALARERLSAVHGAFRGLSSEGPEREEGRWALRLKVEEAPKLHKQVIPTIRYSSVHGWELGAFAHVFREATGPGHLVAELSHLEGIRRVDGDDYAWNYRVGVLVRLSPGGAITAGTDWSRRTKMPIWQGTGSLLDSSVAFFAGGGSASYYALVSRSFFLRLLPSSRIPLDIGFARDEARSLRRIVWRSALGSRVTDDNRPIDDGESVYAFVRWSLDGRDRRVASVDPFVRSAQPSVSVENGIWVGISGESGTFVPRNRPGIGKLKGDLLFARILGDARFYAKLTESASLDVRLRGQWAHDFLPAQLGVWLGGGNTLPGWSESRLFGDTGAVAGFELRRQMTKWGLFATGFGNCGFVRPAKGVWRPPVLFDVGLGVGVELSRLGVSAATAGAEALSAELVRLDVAFPITVLDPESPSPTVVLRLNRRF
jgi:hypothetical protein